MSTLSDDSCDGSYSETIIGWVMNPVDAYVNACINYINIHNRVAERFGKDSIYPGLADLVMNGDVIMC